MDSEILFTGRDLFYLACVFFGAGAGCFLNRFRINAKNRFRNLSLTLGFIFFSIAIIFLAIMLIVTGGRIFTGLQFYITGIVLVVITLLAARFPKAAGFPLVITAGIITVWVAWSFGQYPRFNSSESPGANIGLLETSNGSASLIITGDRKPVQLIPNVTEDQSSDITMTLFEYAGFVPVIGGELRGKITGINYAGKIIYNDIGFSKGLQGFIFNMFREKYSSEKIILITIDEKTMPLPADFFIQNTSDGSFRFGLFFDGKNISLR